MPNLAAEHLTLAYDAHPVVSDLTLTIPEGRISVIVGGNGCGKSTLLRALARLLRPRSGAVLLDGADIRARPTLALARELGLLPQSPTAPAGITVAELVRRGRYPHQGLFKRFSPTDAAAVAEAMELTQITALADRPVDELSGGQRQRAWIALALAQQTDLLLLDEPTTFLDIAHQLEVLDVITDLNARRATTIVIVLHDLNLAARYADHIVALRGGEIYAAGSPTDVITPAMVRDVFALPAHVMTDPVSATPLVLPIGRHHTLGATS